ncbi:chalcone isomerase family protein [Curvibacter sp. APW13]|uniref:chalcone isomerase family protein n=1 Tax=Curvibacter sp. APW13 TaxID=3077236 RepID=UPI0028DF2E82|nr:chalcone isomerase family protein [Curvibacter sp. APW13]MDT8989370.1 chalcone isomerase family protein [Curvibacter sp. APW13]
MKQHHVLPGWATATAHSSSNSKELNSQKANRRNSPSRALIALNPPSALNDLKPTMKLKKRLLVWSTLLVLCLQPSAYALDIAGMKIDDDAEIENSHLKLNGAGIAYKAVFKVYVAALYTSGKVSSFDEVISVPGPKRVALTFIRNVESGTLIRILSQSIQDNTQKSEMSKIIPGLIRLSEMFSANKNIAVGDVVTVDWIPGMGTVIRVQGKQQGAPIKDPDFFRALVSVWVGNFPAEFHLKDALLGIK